LPPAVILEFVPSSSFPIIYVDDLPESLRFYRDALGFSEVYRFPETGEPGYVSLELPDGRLGLSRSDYQPPHNKPLRPLSGQPFELCVAVDDVDSFVERLLQAGVEILAEPEDQPWGERVAYAADPDGNPVHIRGPTG
jgi:lactoylglutathione lyase